MGTFQTFLALAVLIWVLSVIVQAVQEVLKSLLDTKASVMGETVNKFMGAHLTLDQVKGALNVRGLDLTALEHFNKQDFRALLDGIELAAPQVQGVVASANATLDQAKDNIAGAYEAARGVFQKSYTAKNKQWVAALSFVVVLALNASLIRIYEILAANPGAAQAIAATAPNVGNSAAAPAAANLNQAYDESRKTIETDLQKYPILLRTREYPKDLHDEPLNDIVGLLVMGILVSLGAPFWNDVIKSMMGANNVLSTAGKRAS